ncbi:TPA: YadA-like family protein [Escherichia coli]|nr:YadA-like family protein [Escherichia coli]
MSGAHAQSGDVLSTLNGTDSNGNASNFNVRGNYGVTYNLQDTEGKLSKLDAEKADVTQVNNVANLALQNKVDNSINKDAIDTVNADLQANKTLFSAGIHTAQDTANTAVAAAGNAQITADNNTKEITAVADQTRINSGLISDNDTRITKLENAPKPKDGKDGATGAVGAAGKDGVDGKAGKDGIDGKNGVNGANGKDGKNGVNGKDGVNGKNGVTTTITKADTATINAVKTLKTQTSAQAQDLKAAQQVFAQAQANTNSQFKSLKDEVDSNKKEARSGAASAVAIASMPQVEKDQAVMFSAGVGSFKDEQAVSVGASFHVGNNTIVKAGVSDSTNNDFAMGAGVGIGF